MVFAPQSGSPPWPVDTPGGRYYAELDLEAPVTREGQVIFFAQFLHSGGRWARLLEGCPLRYHGNRGSEVADVIGTAALSVLCGHWRYAHINSVRGDTLNPPLLGMSHVVSEDVVRRAMKRMDERAGGAPDPARINHEGKEREWQHHHRDQRELRLLPEKERNEADHADRFLDEGDERIADHRLDRRGRLELRHQRLDRV
jgi:hypothetical protein